MTLSVLQMYSDNHLYLLYIYIHSICGSVMRCLARVARLQCLHHFTRSSSFYLRFICVVYLDV